jgi:Xaa-Pro aminopeptidase
MLTDLDEQMDKRGLQGIIVYGDTTLGNPDLAYVIGGNLARGGIYVKRLHHKPLLVTSNIDMGTARNLGRVKRINTYTQWGLEKLAAKHGRENANQYLIKSILKEEGIQGGVSLHGRNDIATGLRLVDEMRKLGVKIIGGSSPTVLESARETKSKEEVEAIKSVGYKTCKIVEVILESLRNMKRKRGRLYSHRRKATVGLVKRSITSRLAQQNLTAPEGTIFAIGPSGADPHNPGLAKDPIIEGRPIVFDIFPQAATGYWFDLTRSFVVGRANPRAKKLFQTVSEAQTASMDFLREGISGEAAMLRACQVIERAGYRTVKEIFERKTKNISNGFIHSLGHGVGLTIGERPYLSFLSKDNLRSGEVVTVEPGIYLPRYGGLRIEDTVLVTSKSASSLATLPTELELT